MFKARPHEQHSFGLRQLSVVRLWARVLVLLAVLNLSFFVFLLWAVTLSPSLFVERVRDAFASGDLINDDWRLWDSRRGYNQYNDCLVLQMLVNGGDRILASAAGPLLYHNDTYTESCDILLKIVSGDMRNNNYKTTRYTRYWHGYYPLSAAFLLGFDLNQIRWGLKTALYSTLILLVVAAGARHRGLLAVAASIAITGAFFWAVPYFGQSLSHAPGDAFVVLGIACLLFWRERLSRVATFIPFCAAYGAGVVYLEFLTGLLPTAAGLLIPIAYLVAMMQPERQNRPLHGWTFAIAGVTAFALGGGFTVIFKQGLSIAFVGPQAIDLFTKNLKYYTSMSTFDHDNQALVILMPFMMLLRRGTVLTYGSIPGAVVLYSAAALAWLAAGWLAVRSNGARAVSDFLAFAAGVAVIAGWVMLFSTHTIMHSFMTRILIVPIALGWGALVWQLLAAPGPDRTAFRSTAK